MSSTRTYGKKSHPFLTYPVNNHETILNKLTTALMCAGFLLAVGSVGAQDAMKKNDTTAKDGMMDKSAMTMAQCKDHMAMATKDGMKRDNAMMKKDTMCADMMKKDGMMRNGNGSAMQPDNMASGAMKK